MNICGAMVNCLTSKVYYKKQIPYFIGYNENTSTVRTRISQIFGKKFSSFFKNNFTRINHCKFIHHKSHHKSLLSYHPCIVRREYFCIIFNLKKCALYSIKTDTSKELATADINFEEQVTAFSTIP